MCQSDMTSDKFHLKFNNFTSNASQSFQELRDDTDFCDVTLISDGNHQIKAHKVILSASSPFFLEMLRSNNRSHPLIYMRGTKAKELAAIVDFIYIGEAKIFQDDLDTFLALAEEIKLKGLSGIEKEEPEELRQDNVDKYHGGQLNMKSATVIDKEQGDNKNTTQKEIKARESLMGMVNIPKSDNININEVLDTMMERIDGIGTACDHLKLATTQSVLSISCNPNRKCG